MLLKSQLQSEQQYFQESIILSIINQNYNEQEKLLGLYNCQKYWISILKYKNWSSLKNISITNCKINDQNINNFSQHNWPQLQILSLYWNQISDSGVEVLMRNQLPKLKQLRIGHNYLHDDGVKKIFTKLSNRLAKIYIGQCNVTERTIFQMNYYNFSNLLSLSLRNNQIGSKGAKMLTKLHMPKLQSLNIRHCKLGQQGTRYIIKAYWPELTQLWLYDRNLSTINDIMIIREGNWKKLLKLHKQQRCAIAYMQTVLMEQDLIQTTHCIRNQVINENIYEVLLNKQIK